MALINKELFMNKLAEFINKTNRDIADINTAKENNVLWQDNLPTGSNAAILPKDSQIINLVEKVSEQKTGIVLVWSRFNANSDGILNYGWIYSFIPKFHVNNNNDSNGINIPLAGFADSSIGCIYKYIYITDTTIKGHAINADNSWNKKFALRAVLGV